MGFGSRLCAGMSEERWHRSLVVASTVLFLMLCWMPDAQCCCRCLLCECLIVYRLRSGIAVRRMTQYALAI